MFSIKCIDCNKDIDNEFNTFSRISGSYRISIPIRSSSFPCVLCNSCTKKCNICKKDYILIPGSYQGWDCASIYNKSTVRGRWK